MVKCKVWLDLPRSSRFEPPHDKTNKMEVRPTKTQISLGIRPVWSESSLSTWRKLGSLATHWAHSEDSDQTGQMPRLIWVFTGCTATLLVLPWGNLFNPLPYFVLHVSCTIKIKFCIWTDIFSCLFRSHIGIKFGSTVLNISWFFLPFQQSLP